MSDDESEELLCPVCGGPVASVTVIGPDEAIVARYGHHAPPDAVDPNDTDWN